MIYEFNNRLSAPIVAVLQAALDAVEPSAAVERALAWQGDAISVDGVRHPLSPQGRVLLLGGGKAALPMAQGVERALAPLVDAGRVEGLVVTKYGHADTSGKSSSATRTVGVVEAAHPVPDAAGVQAGSEILRLAHRATADDIVIALISGGGSALLEALPAEISLADWQRTTTLLLESGAAITEVNTLRKRLSLVKGGQLARACAPARVITLVLSDIVGSPLDAIASGPTVVDSTHWQDAWAVVQRYALETRLPASVRERLEAGMRGDLTETPNADDPIFAGNQVVIVADNQVATNAAAQRAELLGMRAEVRTNALEGEAAQVAEQLVAQAREMRSKASGAQLPAVLMWGGETTVTLGDAYGLGGRNQEMAVAAALALAGTRGITFVALATDGTDGPTACAGGWADGESVTRAASIGVDLSAALRRHAAYEALAAIDGLLVTGPTRTNVNDVAFAFVEAV